jgi:IS4 transposase
MRSFSPVFAQVMSSLHPQTFARCAALHPLRRPPRGLSVYDHFLALCFAQLTYRESLRDIEACLNARPSLQYHLGFRGNLTRTNLAYANEHRDWRLFATVAQRLMSQARKLYADDAQEPELPAAAFALDASLIHLSARLFPWAGGGRRHATAIKLHLLLGLRGNVPAWAALGPGKVSEVKMLDQLPVEPGCFYVMDRGYLDFSRLRRVAQQGGFFVVRSRRRLGFAVRHSFPVDKTMGLRCDQKIELTNSHSRRAYPEPLRRVRVYDPVRQKSLGLLTNNFAVPAQAVADLYRRRWQVELFFKWIKQHLCIRGFLGVSPNAVQCQLWSALCVYLLVAILKKTIGLTQSLHEILQILSIHPFEQSPIRELLIKTAAEANIEAQQNLFDLNAL